MSIDRKNADINHQDHPHQEGQQNNTTPIDESDGQRRSNTQKQPMKNMMNEPEEKKGGQAQTENDEDEVHPDERIF